MDWVELKKGWPALLGATLALIAGVVTLPYYTAGLFIGSLQQEFGWSRFALSLGPTVLIAGFVLTSPVVGLLTDRAGGHRLVAPGMVVVALGFGALSRLSGSLAEYYLILGVMAVLGNLSGACALTPIIAKTFHRSRGAALGIMMGGIGLGAAVANPLMSWTFASYGRPTAYLAMGAFSLVSAPIVWVLLHARSEQADVVVQRHDGDTLRDAVNRPFYWLMTVSFLAIAVASTGMIVHFVPMLADGGMDPRRAAGIASGIGLSVVAGRLMTGFLIDRLFAPHVAAVIMTLGALCYAVFLAGGPSYAVFGAIAVGLTFGAETDLVGYMAARYFGLRQYGRVFGLMYGLCTAGNGISPLLYGLVKDSTGSYQPMIVAAITLLALSAVSFALWPRFPNLRAADPVGVPAQA